MKSRIFFVSACAFLLALGFMMPRQQQDVKIKTTHVAGSVYMLEGQGGNIGISVGEDGVLMIDDQFARLSEKIRAAIRELNKGDIRMLINTHLHGDHTGGNAFFGKEAVIMAHENVRKRMSREQKRGERVIPPAEEDALPVVTFADGLMIYFNGEEIQVRHLPDGHTDGDAIVYFKTSNVVHLGDDYFSGRFPFVDIDNGGNPEGLLKNINRLIDELPEDVKIIPGHGPLSTLDDLKVYRDMLQETMDTVRKGIEAGKSLEEIQQAGLGEKWQSWNWQFINEKRWIGILHRALTAK